MAPRLLRTSCARASLPTAPLLRIVVGLVGTAALPLVGAHGVLMGFHGFSRLNMV